MKEDKRGISLIVLVITIIVIIILSITVILSLSDNNPIDSAKKAKLLSDLDSFKNELDIYESKQYADKSGDYDYSTLYADENSVTYNGVVDNVKNISYVINSLKINSYYMTKIQVQNGKLVFKSNNSKELNWVANEGYKILDDKQIDVTIGNADPVVVAPKTNVKYLITVNSEVKISNIGTINDYEVVDDLGNTVNATVQIGSLSGLDTDAIRSFDIVIDTTNLITGTYKLKINSGVIKNSSGISNENEIVSNGSFNVDSNPPQISSITATPSLESPTNSDVTIKVEYTDYSVIEYSFDAVTWQSGDIVTVNQNKMIYFRAKDSLGNESAQCLVDITNIDKVAPSDFTPTSSDIGMSTFKISANVTDLDSGIAFYEYYLNNSFVGNNINSSYVYSGLVKNTTYNVYVIAIDKAGNSKKSSTINVTTSDFGGAVDLSVTNSGFSTYRGTPTFQADCVYLANGTILATPETYTVSAPYTLIAKVKNISQATTSYSAIFGLGDGGSNVGSHWLGIFSTATSLWASNGVSDSYSISAPPTKIVTNQWNTLAITHDGANFKFYINNELIGTKASTSSSKTGKIYIGGFSNAGTTSAGVYWYTENGYYSKFAYYKKALTQTEINNLAL